MHYLSSLWPISGVCPNLFQPAFSASPFCTQPYVLASERQNYRPSVHASGAWIAQIRALTKIRLTISPYSLEVTHWEIHAKFFAFPLYFNLFIRSFSNNYCLVFACSAGEVFIGCCNFLPIAFRCSEYVYCEHGFAKWKERIESAAPWKCVGMFFDVFTMQLTPCEFFCVSEVFITYLGNYVGYWKLLYKVIHILT